MRLLLLFSSIMLLSTVSYSQQYIVKVDSVTNIDSFAIIPASTGLYNMPKERIQIPVRSHIKIELIYIETNETLTTLLDEIIDKGEYILDYEEYMYQQKSGMYFIKLIANAEENPHLYPNQIELLRKFVFIK